jgi:hypothetical protein
MSRGSLCLLTRGAIAPLHRRQQLLHEVKVGVSVHAAVLGAHIDGVLLGRVRRSKERRREGRLIEAKSGAGREDRSREDGLRRDKRREGSREKGAASVQQTWT